MNSSHDIRSVDLSAGSYRAYPKKNATENICLPSRLVAAQGLEPNDTRSEASTKTVTKTVQILSKPLQTKELENRLESHFVRSDTESRQISNTSRQEKCAHSVHIALKGIPAELIYTIWNWPSLSDPQKYSILQVIRLAIGESIIDDKTPVGRSSIPFNITDSNRGGAR